ncbi:MAG: hypothetical protein BWZ03_00079 [bacterium ADurb.BinA186]|nr:MAG: hypothetical protein BWZ03_00079 [bacterium ADurb.BinA186]
MKVKITTTNFINGLECGKIIEAAGNPKHQSLAAIDDMGLTVTLYPGSYEIIAEEKIEPTNKPLSLKDLLGDNVSEIRFK